MAKDNNIAVEEALEAARSQAEAEEEEAENVLSFDELMAADDLGTVYIPLPAPYQGGVRARPLSMAELHQIRRDSMRRIKDERGRVVGTQLDELAMNKEIILLSLSEPRLDAAKVDALFTKNNKLVRAIVDVLTDLNGLNDAAAAEVQRSAEAAFPG